MDIVILGYKFKLELLIFIGIVYLILVGHTFCGCCNYGLIETFATAKKMMDLSGNSMDLSGNLSAAIADMSGNAPVPGTLANKIKNKKEGFSTYTPYDLKNENAVDTSSWSASNMTVIPGQPYSSGVSSVLSRDPQPIPLPDNEMLLFANTPFKPECCPNTYSTSQGCACMTGQQYNYLVQRGMNNVPYSEY